MLRGIQVEAESEVEGLRLVLAAGGRLRIRYEGSAAYASVQVRQAGLVIAADGILTGTERFFVVPAGELTVECSTDGEHAEERTVDVLVGEDQTVLFDL